MKARQNKLVKTITILAIWPVVGLGCSTTEVVPHGPPAALPPPYVQVPHPAGHDLADVRAIFTDPLAAKPEDLKDCDVDLKKLKSLTQSVDELAQGARELVKGDPVRYHWCYYGNILKLEEDLKSESFLHERQKKLLDTYSFLAPIGRAFMQEFHDSRYMRWGVQHYRQLSVWIFYRNLEATPEATSELVGASNPFGLVREPASSKPILEKYNIVRPQAAPSPVAASLPVADLPPPPSAAPDTAPSAVSNAASNVAANPPLEPQSPAAAPAPTPVRQPAEATAAAQATEQEAATAREIAAQAAATAGPDTASKDDAPAEE